MNKSKRYEHIYKQCQELIKRENDFISKLSTIASLLHIYTIKWMFFSGLVFIY